MPLHMHDVCTHTSLYSLKLAGEVWGGRSPLYSSLVYSWQNRGGETPRLSCNAQQPDARVSSTGGNIGSSPLSFVVGFFGKFVIEPPRIFYVVQPSKLCIFCQ